MLSQVGLLSLPQTTVAAALDGRYLEPEEARAVAGHPALGAELIRKIPRLEAVAEIIEHQRRSDWISDSQKPITHLTCNILRAATDYEMLTAGGVSHESAMLRLRERPGWYADEVLDALARIGRVAA
jgi:hypothetical protein